MKMRVLLGVALIVLVVGLWLALATGLVGSHARPDWSCIDSNLGGEPPPLCVQSR
jgi:hypothetical protein